MAVAALDEAAEAAEFAALVAELKAPTDADEGVESEDADEDSDEPEVSELEDEPEKAEEEEEDPEEEDEPEEDGLSAAEAAAKKLFEAGDLKGACKRLGIDPKIFKIKQREFTAMRKGLADAARLSREAAAAKAQSETLHTKAEEVYGPIVAGFKAYKGGNPMQLRAAIELMCEDSFENVVATVARAAKGLDPAQVEVIKLRKELADREAKQKEEQTKAQQEASSKAEVAKVAKALATTPLAKVDGAAQEIYDLVRASFDGVGYGLTVKQAYAQVKAKHARIAAAFGNKPQKKVVPSKREELREIRAPKKMTPAEREAADQAEFQAVLREAKEATRATERRARRVK